MTRLNFFIVGAAKSGTTSLWMYLKQHPEVYMPSDPKFKEPAYYCHSYGMTGVEEYHRLFSDVRNERAIGEASTAYMTAPESAGLLHAAHPDARIIVILRNPVDRAYSLYRWMVNHGYEWIYPFEAALEEEKIRKNDADFFSGNPENFYNYMYFHSGLYSRQLERYFSLFPRENIKVLLMEDIQHRPAEVMRDVFGFLDVDVNFKPEFKVYNRAELRPVHVKWHFHLNALRRRFPHTRKSVAITWLFEMNMKLLSLKWPGLKPEIRNALLARYHDDITRTGKMIDRDLSAWFC